MRYILNDNQESLNFPAGAFFVYKQFKYWCPETPVEAAEESISRVKTENTLLGYRIDGSIGCDFCANLEAKEPQAVLQARPCLLERCKCAKNGTAAEVT